MAHSKQTRNTCINTFFSIKTCFKDTITCNQAKFEAKQTWKFMSPMKETICKDFKSENKGLRKSLNNAWEGP